MRKILATTVITLLCFAACTTQKPLYNWDKYHIASYNYLKNSDEKAIQGLIKTYQKIIAKQKGSRHTVPPGVYADYGLLLLQADKVEEGKKMLQMEIALYPESTVFIGRILKMLEK